MSDHILQPNQVFAALDATWPPAEMSQRDGWQLRVGAGGGKRVSAATRRAADADIPTAEAHMRALGQTPLFMITPVDADLDADLDARGYAVVDPVTILALDPARIPPVPGNRVIECEAPLALMAEIWGEGGIGPARLDVMARTRGPKSYLFARNGDHAAGVGFVALESDIAMLHAVQVAQAHRKNGVGRMLTAAAAQWAHRQGARALTLAVADANAPALALYRGFGMTPVVHYHYRHLPISTA